MIPRFHQVIIEHGEPAAYVVFAHRHDVIGNGIQVIVFGVGVRKIRQEKQQDQYIAIA